MGLLMWLREPGRRGVLIGRLYGEDTEAALDAVNELRAQRWLTDASMRGVELREANLPGANLSGADLEETNISSANLAGANLNEANLRDANLAQSSLQDAVCYAVNLQAADLHLADLRRAALVNADLRNTNLASAALTEADMRGALLEWAILNEASITEGQLATAHTLCGALMSDGSIYDGRFNLPGDLASARSDGYDPDDPQIMAEYYDASLEAYESGQEWAQKNLRKLRKREESKSEESIQATDEETDDTDMAPALSRWNPLSYASLILWICDAPADLLQYRRDASHHAQLRGMAAWLAATLLWLPVFMWHSVFLVNSRVSEGVSARYPMVPSQAVLLIEVFWLALVITGWVLTIWSSRRQTVVGTAAGVLACLIALFFSLGSGFRDAPLYITGYLLGLLVGLVVGGQRVRLIAFWVAVILLGPLAYVGLAQLALFLLHDIRVFANTANVGILFIVIRVASFALSFLVVYVLRYAVKAHIMRNLGKPNSNLVGITLIVGYLASFSLLAWWIFTGPHG